MNFFQAIFLGLVQALTEYLPVSSSAHIRIVGDLMLGSDPGAAFTAICKKAGVPVQVFANRADVPGGSTLGNLLGHQILMPMVDIGLGQLAMHSAMETASCADAEYMAKAVAEYYNTPIFQPKDGEWKLGL